MEDFVQQNLEENDFAAEDISYTHVSSIRLEPYSGDISTIDDQNRPIYSIVSDFKSRLNLPPRIMIILLIVAHSVHGTHYKFSFIGCTMILEKYFISLVSAILIFLNLLS